MGRRYNAERALKAARAAELKAWDAYQGTPDRTAVDVATAPVVGDAFTGHGGRTWKVSARSRCGGYVWSMSDDCDGVENCVIAPTWGRMVRAAASVSPVESPTRAARRKVWERAAARVERARTALEALPPKGHKRRKDGTVYPVAGPRENAARAAGRAAFHRAIGRSLTFAAVVVAFLSLFLSACN